jgi:hypothetical protein
VVREHGHREGQTSRHSDAGTLEEQDKEGRAAGDYCVDITRSRTAVDRATPRRDRQDTLVDMPSWRFTVTPGASQEHAIAGRVQQVVVPVDATKNLSHPQHRYPHPVQKTSRNRAPQMAWRVDARIGNGSCGDRHRFTQRPSVRDRSARSASGIPAGARAGASL